VGDRIATRVSAGHALPSGDEFHPPHPARVTIVALLPSLVPLALWVGGAIPSVAAVVTGAVLLTMAAAHIGYAWFDLIRCRRLADRLLLAYPHARFSSPVVEWRADELTSVRMRRYLASWVRLLIEEADAPRRLTWSPLNRGAALRGRYLLRRLETRLGDLSRPVSPRGVLIVRELLADGTTSPLYRSDRADTLPDALAEALADLTIDAREPL
jgi:hypothetical protein